MIIHLDDGTARVYTRREVKAGAGLAQITRCLLRLHLLMLLTLMNLLQKVPTSQF